MFKFFELSNKVLFGVLLSSMILVGCQPDPKEGVAAQQTEDGSSEMTTVEKDMSEDINENNIKDEPATEVESKSDKVDLERRTSAIAKKETAATEKM